jgi:hypothetical protein
MDGDLPDDTVALELAADQPNTEAMTGEEREAMERAAIRARPITGRSNLDAGVRQGWWAASDFYPQPPSPPSEAEEALRAEIERLRNVYLREESRADIEQQRAESAEATAARYREALALIASCDAVVDGDVVAIARAALLAAQ